MNIGQLKIIPAKRERWIKMTKKNQIILKCGIAELLQISKNTITNVHVRRLRTSQCNNTIAKINEENELSIYYSKIWKMPTKPEMHRSYETGKGKTNTLMVAVQCSRSNSSCKNSHETIELQQESKNVKDLQYVACTISWDKSGDLTTKTIKGGNASAKLVLLG